MPAITALCIAMIGNIMLLDIKHSLNNNYNCKLTCLNNGVTRHGARTRHPLEFAYAHKFGN